MRKTFGGRQFWTDHFLHHDWRIQRHCRSGEFRLLDEANCLRHTGTFDSCLGQFRDLVVFECIAPMESTVVVLLHGLGDVRKIMRHLECEIRNIDGYSAVSMDYASTRNPMADHADALASIVEHLSDAKTIHFVSYSMGSIVVRHYLADLQRLADSMRTDSSNAATSVDKHAETSAKFGRQVMIGAPNHGAELAKMIGIASPILPAILGESSVQLGRRWEETRDRLATPSFEFGIIAGSSGRLVGGNPFISGANDWVVGVEETKLAGAADFRVYPVAHALMPRSRRVIDSTVQFLKHGYFESPETARPLLEQTLAAAPLAKVSGAGDAQ